MSADEEVSPQTSTEEEPAADSSPATEDTPPEAEAAGEEPAEEDDAAEAVEGAESSKKVKKKRTPKPKKPVEAPKVTKAGYPKTSDMIVYALESIGSGRKGGSVQAIKSFILKTYPAVKKEKLKRMLRIGLEGCVESGAIKRPEGQEEMQAMQGRYKVVKTPRNANPSGEEMVVAAVGACDERKGATVNSIKAYILDNYDHVRPEMLRHQIRAGLKKALAKGLVAPHTPGKDGKVSLAARWHIKGDAKKDLQKKKSEERKIEAAKEAARAKAAAAREAAKKKSLAAKRAQPKKPTAKKAVKKAAPKKAAPKKAAPKKATPKRSRR